MTETLDVPEGAGDAAPGPLGETWASLRSVFSNPGLRKLQLALVGSQIGDWAYGTAVAVWAYGVGGPKAVGVWMAIRMGLMAFTSPFTAALADKFNRKLVMVLADLVRALLVVGAAVCLLVDSPAAPVFVLATLAGLLGTPFRAARQALTPSLSRTPAELTASNGAASTVESISIFLGPALGAGLLTVASVQVVFLVNAATYLWSLLLVASIRVPHAAVEETGDDEEAAADAPAETSDEPDAKATGFVAESMAGFRAIWRDKDLFVVTLEVSLQTIIAGATTVFPLVIAVEILGTGPKGVGYLDSIFGVGAVVGGFIAISRAARERLALDMTLGVVLWSLPLLLIAVSPTTVAAVAALLLIGFANPLVDVNMETIVQRITPDEVLGRVFGALEACLIATMALGAAVTPLLLHLFGLRSTLAILGLVVGVAALAGAPRMRRLDARLRPPATLPLLQRIALFAPLPPAVQESLARSLVPVQVGAGEVLLHEGDESDRFFVIETGRVRVTQGDRVLREEGPGEFFGEIGLLRDVPRTATITALEDTTLLTLGRDAFLGAVTGVGEARVELEDVVRRRLAA